MRGYLPGHTPDLQNGGVASYEVDERGVAIAQLWDSLAPQILMLQNSNMTWK